MTKKITSNRTSREPKGSTQKTNNGLTRVMSTEDQQPTTNNRETKSRPVWTFTNQRQLSKSEFINYFERKVFRTIRKFSLLPKNKTFKIPKSDNLNANILKKILETKFKVEYSKQPNISTSNLSQESENIFKEITKGNFNYSPANSPLLYLSDKEVELYAKLKKIKGKKRIQNKKIQNLFKKFISKNQDLELNILKAQNQLL